MGCQLGSNKHLSFDFFPLNFFSPKDTTIQRSWRECVNREAILTSGMATMLKLRPFSQKPRTSSSNMLRWTFMVLAVIAGALWPRILIGRERLMVLAEAMA